MCGVSSDQTTNESGGRRYPWAVSVMYEDRNRLGGTIISPFHILTAAHPFVRFDNSLPGIGEPWYMGIVSLKLILAIGKLLMGMIAIGIKEGGSNITRVYLLRETIDGSGFGRKEMRALTLLKWMCAVRSTLNSISHLKYCYKLVCVKRTEQKSFECILGIDCGCLSGHDWAIIEVAERIEFSDTVRPICLPSLELTSLLDGDRFMIVGWGRPTVFGASDPLIKEIPMVHDPKCEAPLSDFMPSKNPDYLCAKALNPRNDDSPRTCHGDSGSGLEHRDGLDKATLLGITSFGSRGCPSNELARFTRAANYLSRICALTGVCYSTE
ncbi:trypsin domain-containing protein [Ditylenchus destructor]|nr:trypsin domain-containing protein [Ditylenchus destructor]